MADPGLDTPHDIHAFRTAPPQRDAPGFARHIHHSHELITLARGTAWQFLGPREQPFATGDLFFLPAGSWHICGSRGPATCVVLNFYDASFTDTLPGDRDARRIVDALSRRALAGAPRLDVTPATRREVLARLAAMVAAGECRDELGRACAIKGELLAILARLAADAALNLASGERVHFDPDRERLERVAAFVRRHLAEPLSVPSLAAVAGISASHFHAVFKRRTGMTFVDYVTRARVQAAADLLRASALPIKEVARQSGFPCLSHFYAVFRRHTGLAPGRFVAAARSGG
jgi:AraC-like DNA-binding protein